MAKTKKSNTEQGEPVSGFPIQFEWYSGDWKALFDKQVAYIQDELRRMQADDRVICYLSCPISSRGGGHFATNVDMARATGQRLAAEWGQRFFILNPVSYQMHSKEGTGLIRRHAEIIGLETGKKINVDKLPRARGGDYMRMWTRVLVEDDYLSDPDRRGLNLGGLFDAYYFLAPHDTRLFFMERSGSAGTVGAGIEQYFAEKFTMDLEFQDYFSPRDAKGEPDNVGAEQLRNNFFRFYAIRASTSYSKGAHDEWNIWSILNRRRLASTEYGLGERIAGFYDGRQVDPASQEDFVYPGYAISTGADPEAE